MCMFSLVLPCFASGVNDCEMRPAQHADRPQSRERRGKRVGHTRVRMIQPSRNYNPSTFPISMDSACARIVRVRCRSRTVRSRIYQLADRHQYVCTHIKFIKIRSFERACGPAEVGYSEQVARIRCISMRPTVSPRARIWACAVKPDLLEHLS